MLLSANYSSAVRVRRWKISNLSRFNMRFYKNEVKFHSSHSIIPPDLILLQQNFFRDDICGVVILLKVCVIVLNTFKCPNSINLVAIQLKIYFKGSYHAAVVNCSKSSISKTCDFHGCWLKERTKTIRLLCSNIMCHFHSK